MVFKDNNTGGLILTGKVVGEPKYRKVGEKQYSCCTVGIGAEKEKIYNVTAWFGLAEVLRKYNKGDSIMVTINEVKDREYEGKTYTDYVADYVPMKPFALNNVTEKTEQKNALTPIEEDDLPF